MDRRLDWIVQSGVLAVALFLATVGGMDWLQYAVAALAWWTLVTTVWTIPSPSRSAAVIAVPQVGAVAFDLAVLASMFLAQWYWTAFAYAVSCGCVALAKARAASHP